MGEGPIVGTLLRDGWQQLMADLGQPAELKLSERTFDASQLITTYVEETRGVRLLAMHGTRGVDAAGTSAAKRGHEVLISQADWPAASDARVRRLVWCGTTYDVVGETHYAGAVRLMLSRHGVT